jgi:hypothetical protein
MIRSRVIHYLDPDFQLPTASFRQYPDLEGLIILILLLGRVVVSVAALYIQSG